MRRRRLLGVALAVLAAGCSRETEPSEADMRQAIERVHSEWASERRKDQAAQTPDLFRRLPNVNLGFEAALSLRITSVRKVDCRRASDSATGFICRAVVGASVGGRPSVLQNIQGRFVQGGTKWTVRDIVVLDLSG